MIKLENVSKSYDGITNVVENLSLTIAEGELIVLVGESGCGKTTTMEMINRLNEPTRGDILIDDINIKDLDKNSLRKNVGYVIQNVGLFPHKTIEENISTVPRMCKKNKHEISDKVKELFKVIELPYEEYAHRYPRELSGGQQQRVGVARALANDPDIILMDEPFSALDPITREQLQEELLRLQDELNKTIVFVTHDIDEAIKIGDKIAVMQDGKIVQYDTPENILKTPVNEFVEEFVGKDRLWKTPEMLSAKDVMLDPIVEIGPNRSVAQAIEVMKKRKMTVLAIVDSTAKKPHKLLGLVGANRFYGIFDNSIKMKDIMKTELNKIPSDMPLNEVMELRTEKKIHTSAVVDENDGLIGFITDTSILNVLNEIMPESEDY